MDIQELLENPSPENWKEIVKIGRRCAGKPTWQPFTTAVLTAIPSWPKEIERIWPEGIGPSEFKGQVEWRIREVDTYGHYCQKIAGDSRLQLNGRQRVWLERRFTGGVVPASVAKQVIATLLDAVKRKHWGTVSEAVSVLAGSIRNTGKTGTADLTGGLMLKHARKGTFQAQESLFNTSRLPLAGVTPQNATEIPGDSLEIRLEIEIKVGDGKQRPDQVARQNSVTSRGGCYLLVRSVEEAVQGILQFIAFHE